MKTLQTKLEKIRGEIEALNAEREDIELAPITRDEAVTKIATVINAPFSNTVIDPGGPNARVDVDPAPSGLLDGSFSGVGLHEMLNRPGILQAVIPDALRAYLIELYDVALGDVKPGLPQIKRRARLAELDAEIFRLEVDEEGICEEIEAGGADILRRVDASAIAQLGLSPDAGEAA